jgi:predicted transcriptional regulator
MKNILDVIPSKTLTTDPNAFTVGEIAQRINSSITTVRKQCEELVDRGEAVQLWRKLKRGYAKVYLLVEKNKPRRGWKHG